MRPLTCTVGLLVSLATSLGAAGALGQRTGDDPTSSQGEVSSWERAGEYAIAIDALTDKIRHDPHNPHLYAKRGMLRRRNREPFDAVRDYNRVLKLDPDYPSIHSHLGCLWAEIGDYPRAIAELNQEIRRRPRDGGLYLARGKTWALAARDHDIGVGSFDELTLVDYSEVHTFQGLVVEYKEGHRRAVSDFSRVIHLDPARAAAFNERGSTYCRMGKYEEAIADFDEAIRLDPELAAAYVNRGLAHYHKGEPDPAAADFDKAIQLDPQNAMAYTSRGNDRLARGNLKGAIEDYTRAAQESPGCPYALSNLAWLYATCAEGPFRDKEKAIALAERALSLAKQIRRDDPWFQNVMAAAGARATDWHLAAAESHLKVAEDGMAGVDRLVKMPEEAPKPEEDTAPRPKAPADDTRQLEQAGEKQAETGTQPPGPELQKPDEPAPPGARESVDAAAPPAEARTQLDRAKEALDEAQGSLEQAGFLHEETLKFATSAIRKTRKLQEEYRRRKEAYDARFLEVYDRMRRADDRWASLDEELEELGEGVRPGVRQEEKPDQQRELPSPATPVGRATALDDRPVKAA